MKEELKCLGWDPRPAPPHAKFVIPALLIVLGQKLTLGAIRPVLSITWCRPLCQHNKVCVPLSAGWAKAVLSRAQVCCCFFSRLFQPIQRTCAAKGSCSPGWRSDWERISVSTSPSLLKCDILRNGNCFAPSSSVRESYLFNFCAPWPFLPANLSQSAVSTKYSVHYYCT